jgi:hypothetical protein
VINRMMNGRATDSLRTLVMPIAISLTRVFSRGRGPDELIIPANKPKVVGV